MNTRAFFRWLLAIGVAVGLLGVIGLVLNPPVKARATTVYDWPSVLPPCNASLQQCIDAAVVLPGDTIDIKPGVYTQSVTLAKPVSLIGAGPLTAILNAEPGQRVLTVTGNLSSITSIYGLTFKDGNASGAVCPDACGGGMLIVGAVRPTLQNIVFLGNSAAWQGGGLWVDAGPALNLTNVSFISNTAFHAGGGLFAVPDTLLISSYFERNTSNDNGGGVHVDGEGSTLTAIGTDFVLNSATNAGGGAHINSAVVLSAGRFTSNRSGMGGGLFASQLSMTNTDFVDNEAAGSYGGGAYINGPVQLNGGRFEQNRSLGFGFGGGLYAMGLDARGTVFISNTASSLSAAGYGGGAYLSSNPSTLEDVSFIGNLSSAGGGGLNAGAPLALINVAFISNTTQGSGGGLIGQSVAISGGVFDRNTSAGAGGALYAFSNLTVVGAKLTNNAANNNGGGVYAGGSVWVTSTLFIRNSAQDGGGLYQSPAGDAHIVNALFARNQSAPTQAAAIAFAATGSFSMVHSTIVDNVFNPASAISIDNGNAASDLRDNIISGHGIGLNLLNGGSYEDYNLYFNNSTNVTGPVTFGGHSLPNAAPQFINPLNDDYHLRFTSPAINAGINVGVDFDIDGQRRPIGSGFDIGFDEAAGTLQDLINSTPDGGTAFIPPGVFTESLTLSHPVNLVGAGPGSTIVNAASNDRVLTITGNTILPNTQIVSLTLRGGYLLTDTCSGFCNGGGVLITGMASPTFRDVAISDNQAMMGGGLYVQSGGAQLLTSVITGNQATQSGGGAYVESTNAVLEQIGGAFVANRAKDGAGVFVQSGQFKQISGTIYNNNASHWGGGMLIGSGGTIKTIQGQIISNSAVYSGGGVLVDVGYAELVNSVVQNNAATEGAGIYVRDLLSASVAVQGGKVIGNRATGYGGGVYAGSTLAITATHLAENKAYDGSAVEITGTAQVRLVNAVIVNNAANGAYPSTNSSVRFDSSGDSVALHTTFGNSTQILTRALAVNNGVVTVANTIVASYTNGLGLFNGYLVEDYNLYFQTPLTFTGAITHGGHSLLGLDPLFQNPLNSDYHIKGLSPAVNRGTDVGVRRDLDLDPRPLGGGFDIGADEASVAGALPGPGTGSGFTYTTTQFSTINLNVPPGAVTQTTPI